MRLLANSWLATKLLATSQEEPLWQQCICSLTESPVSRGKIQVLNNLMH